MHTNYWPIFYNPYILGSAIRCICEEYLCHKIWCSQELYTTKNYFCLIVSINFYLSFLYNGLTKRGDAMVEICLVRSLFGLKTTKN